jgi:uncharacterized membrane protein
MNTVDVLTEITIAAPIDLVSGYASDPDNSRAWYNNIKSVQWQTAKPLSVGSQVTFTAHFLGRRLEYTYHITEFIPGQKMVMETSEGPFPMQTTYTWEKTAEGLTHMTLRNKGWVSGFSGGLTPLISVMMKKANMKDLKNLKRILEKQEQIIF